MTTTILPVVELWLSFNGTAELALSIDCPSRLLNARSLLLILSSGYDFSVTLSMGEKDTSPGQRQVRPSMITLQV